MDCQHEGGDDAEEVQSAEMDTGQQLKKDVCLFYQQGKCRFGNECFNLHEGEVVVSSRSPPRDVHTNATKTTTDEATAQKLFEKKPSLRTAGDVRKRIQWDPALPSEYFSVGYLDRFDGVVEKPFGEFSWIHLANAEVDELAIPQHRIQFYKYKGKTVWDKSLRLDNVFGSAGNDKTILEVMAEVDEEEERKKDDPFSDDDSDDDNIVVTDGRAASQGGVSSGGLTTQAEIQQKFDDQLRATHFLCIRVASEEVAEGVREVQRGIIEDEPELRCCAMPSEILHVTLCMIKCSTPEAIERMSEILEEIRLGIKDLKEYDPERNVLKARGLSTFGARVLFSQLDVPPLFTRMVQLLQDKLKREEGIVITNHFDFVPHMTLLKVNRVVAKERRSKYLNSSLYNKHISKEFGDINFNNIHFCVIDDYRGPDNFYLTHKVIHF